MADNMRNLGKGLEIMDMVLDSAQLIQIVPRLYNRFVKGEQSAEEKQQELIEMIHSGKSPEAMEETINSWTTGLSDEDEMRLLRDVCHLITGSQITIEEGYNFFAFLNSCDVELRGRFREAYITDKEQIMRWGVVVVIAKLPDDDLRMMFMKGAGLMDPTMVEQLVAALQVPLDTMGDWARERLPVLEANHALREANKLDAANITRKRTLLDKLLKREPSDPPKSGSWAAAFRAMFKFEI